MRAALIALISMFIGVKGKASAGLIDSILSVRVTHHSPPQPLSLAQVRAVSVFLWEDKIWMETAALDVDFLACNPALKSRLNV